MMKRMPKTILLDSCDHGEDPVDQRVGAEQQHSTAIVGPGQINAATPKSIAKIPRSSSTHQYRDSIRTVLGASFCVVALASHSSILRTVYRLSLAQHPK
jgi:hypothetical protein